MEGGTISFTYRDGAGKVGTHTLKNWNEVGRYIQGVSVEAGQFRTYLKHRVLEYLNDAATLLDDPYPAPPVITKSSKAPAGPEIVFTGFAKAHRADLERMAALHGLRVVGSVTKGLTLIVGGGNAGPAKMEQAREQNVIVLEEEGFLRMIETGEVPDPFSAEIGG
ncbi:MAG: hypothetical protein JSR83_01030 [Proteobacteria bacterium]|nr:hypothetical protein [Pseudomonadota bacterium]